MEKLKLKFGFNFTDSDVQEGTDFERITKIIMSSHYKERRKQMYEERVLTISEVSRITNTPCHTLRFWEKEFAGILEPLRTKGGQRRYTEATVALIEQIRRLRENGASLSRIKRSLHCFNDQRNGIEDKIDNLAQRVSGIIKDEIYNFFRGDRKE